MLTYTNDEGPFIQRTQLEYSDIRQKQAAAKEKGKRRRG